MNDVKLNLPPLTWRDLPHLVLMGAFVFLTASHFQLPWYLESFDDNSATQEPVLAPIAQAPSFKMQSSELLGEPGENLAPGRDEVVDETAPVIEAFQPNS